ncbi:hypothetical protein [Lysobacter enzymogenes]|uniref:hypothetical protein n=1 Tax=Lysobacter enzymogenes TaxID=69 RepID=UPI001A969190|nr:hypothetical protein [Lysobacter enzymogenes]QQP97944.1 hypothetical protein JHW38_08055 [Lysobacter enzymogenes]
MKRIVLAVSIAVAPLSALAAQAPQVTIEGAKTEDARFEVAQRCTSTGGVIEENTPHQLICSKPLGDSARAELVRLLAASPSSTDPHMKLRYSFAESGGRVLISADAYLESQAAGGRVDRTPLTNDKLMAQGQQVLDGIKAKLERRAAAPAKERAGLRRPN